MPPPATASEPKTATAAPSAVDQWLDSPQFASMMQNEFPEDAAEWLDPVTRRQFLTVMGASVALAGAIGCNPSFKPAPSRQVVPYVKQPDELLPGVPLFFATAYPQQSGVGLPLLVKQTDRPADQGRGEPDPPREPRLDRPLQPGVAARPV